MSRTLPVHVLQVPTSTVTLSHQQSHARPAIVQLAIIQPPAAARPVGPRATAHSTTPPTSYSCQVAVVPPYLSIHLHPIACICVTRHDQGPVWPLLVRVARLKLRNSSKVQVQQRLRAQTAPIYSATHFLHAAGQGLARARLARQMLTGSPNGGRSGSP
jgi:hypothetical protein